ncbi:MAG: MBL fold metallo-hydrolase [Chlamydiales bacterium]|nr:MBL fold metallo-hydrolase [Chlamydiales bacterium]
MRKGKIIVLGTGGSAGSPAIGNPNAKQIMQDRYNYRLRTSILIQIDQKNILVDPGPDVRYQALKFGINKLDGVLITHTHFDHIAGLDELRMYYFVNHQPNHLLLSKESYQDLEKRCYYLIDQTTQIVNKDQKYNFHLLPKNEGTISFCGEEFSYFSYYQAGMKVTGFRIGSFAFVTDIKEYDPSIFHYLNGLDVLMVSALREKESPVHFNFEDAVAFARQTRTKEAYFVHIAQEVEHHAANKKLPSQYQLAYDGMELEFYVR